MSKSIYITFLAIVFVLLLTRLFHFYATRHSYSDGEAVVLSQTLLLDTQDNGHYQTIALTDNDGNRIFVTVPSYPVYGYGDTLKVSGRVAVKSNKKGVIQFSMNYPQIEKQHTSFVLVYLSMVRERVRSLYTTSLGQLDSSLLMGIVFGIKESFPTDFSTALQTTGLFHVIAASGMNVSMVGGTLLLLLKKRFRRQIALVLSLLILGIYAVLSGLQPSILRASLMTGLAFSASILGRQNDGFTALFTAGSGMVLYEPFLLFDIGFQLSFLSTFGIITLKPLLTFKGVFFENSIVDDILTTTSSQIITLPLMFSAFGQYGVLSILVNALVLWTIPPLMILGGVGAIVGLVVPLLSIPFLYLCLPFMWFFEWVVTFFGRLGLNFTISEFPFLLLIGYYCLLFSLCLLIKRKRDMV